MTAKQPCPYRDFALRGQWIHPELCNLPNGALLASGPLGVCAEVNPDSGRVAIQPRIGGISSSVLSSPAASASEPIICSVASHVIWTELWHLGAHQTSRVKTYDAVNSVALSPEGDLLATGLGMYPLDPSRHPNAAIELFSIADPSEALMRTLLPGVAVDRVAFHPMRELLVAVTGARSQDRGHVLLLNRHTLNLLDVAETDFVFCRDAIIDVASDRLILATRNGVQVRSLDALWKVEWESRADGLLSAAHDAERNWIFLSNGQVLSPDVGEIARLPVLDKCSGLAVLRDGRVAGISEGNFAEASKFPPAENSPPPAGVLRVWEVGFGWVPS